MKVCMVVHQAFSVDARVVRYANALAGAGADVDVLCLGDPVGEGRVSPPGVRVRPLALRRRAAGPLAYALECLVSTTLFGLRLSRLHLGRRYDVVHVHNMPDFLVFAALLPRLLGAKIVLDVHDPMPEVFQSKFGRSREGGLLLGLLRLQERLSARFAHAVVTANDQFAEVLSERGVPAAKITVVRNLPDPAVFARRDTGPRPANGRFTLIFPGTIAARYGLDVAIRGIALLRDRVPGIQLVVLGPEGPERDQLEALADELGVADRVVFRPKVPNDQVPAALEAADVGIYPAIPDRHMTIAEPGKVLEFAAMGLPVIASRVRVLEQAFGESALAFVEPGNPEDFARRVVELAESPERRRELVENADRAFVTRFSWEEHRDRYLALLRRLAGEGP